MSNEDALWASDPERRLVVRAVAKFSDDCSAPDLTPSCPFYELTSTGPIWAEQCRDLMERYPADLIRPDHAFLGNALGAVRRPRARHGPDKTDRAFDARERHLSDGKKPLTRWWMTSLLVELLERVTNPGENTRDAAPTESLLRELSHRGH